ncbi:MAG: sodium ion-translocating decarboxylase subunit beta [Clostridiaceae bacterium]|jgi:oxaloacetate decarboxylase beta subunit|nr:sodium ion-translocating decarboxylase subunit beta [Clostridiaceae bacterium]
MWNDFIFAIKELALESGFAKITLLHFVLIVIACVFIYLAIARKYEPLLLLPIAFGMLLANLPLGGLMHPELWDVSPIDYNLILHNGGLLDLLYLGVKLGIFPPLIFLGIGAMTDFGPLIANPKSFLLGAAAQFGIFGTFIGAMALGNFTEKQAGAIAIIGGADGPTAIWLTSKLAPELLGPIALAAYSYMALVPIIQPPIMKALTTKKEREVVMEQLRPVSKLEKILFPILVSILVILILPAAAPLVGMLMLGNLFKESGVVERLNETAQNALINIVTIFLGLTVGATASADKLSQPGFGLQALSIIILGLLAFSVGTASGLLFGKLMYWATGGKVNPLIGSAGVSAVPMAARVSQVVGQKANPQNFLLMHAMGPNVAGVIGSAVAAGVLLSMLG